MRNEEQSMAYQSHLFIESSAAHAAKATHEPLPNLVHTLVYHKLRERLAEYLWRVQATKLIFDRITILFDDIIVQLVEILDELFRRCELVVGEQCIYVVEDICGIALKPLQVVGILAQRLNAMNNRDKGVNQGISELVNALIALEVLRRHESDLTSREEAAHRVLKVICEALFSCEAYITHCNHSMNLSLNVKLGLLEHIVDRLHELINVLAHPFLQVI